LDRQQLHGSKKQTSGQHISLPSAITWVRHIHLLFCQQRGIRVELIDDGPKDFSPLRHRLALAVPRARLAAWRARRTSKSTSGSAFRRDGTRFKGTVVEVKAKTLEGGRVVPGWAKVELDDGSIVDVPEADFEFD
jgi:hypothetical protein